MWRGGATTELTVMMPVNALTALPRHVEMEKRICELANTGLYDDEIARILTSEGHRSPWRGTEVLASTVRGIRLRHRIKTARQRNRWPPVPGCLTVAQLAERLRIPQNGSTLSSGAEPFARCMNRLAAISFQIRNLPCRLFRSCGTTT